MVDFQGFYITKGSNFKTELDEKLKSEYKNIENLGSLPTVKDNKPVVVVLHLSKVEGLVNPNSQINNIVEQASLIVFFSQGEKNENYSGNYFPSVTKRWLVNPEDLISNFDKFHQHLKDAKSIDDWSLDAWIKPKPYTLSALSILCQGYLAVCQPNQLEDWDKVKDLITTDLKTKEGEVQKPSWWRKPFAKNEAEIKETESEKITQKAEDLKATIKNECQGNKTDDIEKLIDAIYESELIEDITIVEKAYQEIQKYLNPSIKTN